MIKETSIHAGSKPAANVPGAFSGATSLPIMFKQASIYKITGLNLAALETDLKAKSFISCGASQEKSVGWVPPRGHEHGLMAETIGGQTIIKLMIETKSVPSDAVRRATDERIKQVEDATGRKPGKKGKREIMDEVLLSMLPNAFAKQAAVTGWITDDGLLILDNTSSGRTDEFISALFNATEGISVSMLQTTTNPQAAMTQWLLADDMAAWGRDDFCIERETVLKSTGEDAAIVKFTKHHLGNDDVRKHVLQGKLPSQLALSWEGKASFLLTEHLALKKIQFLDGVLDASGTDKHEDRFDADVALATGTLRPLITSLVDALGGEMKHQQGDAS